MKDIEYECRESDGTHRVSAAVRAECWVDMDFMVLAVFIMYVGLKANARMDAFFISVVVFHFCCCDFGGR